MPQRCVYDRPLGGALGLCKTVGRTESTLVVAAANAVESMRSSTAELLYIDAGPAIVAIPWPSVSASFKRRN